MKQLQPDWPKTLDEFRAWHEQQPDVWEFIQGLPRLMAPGSKAHTLIKGNTARSLGNALDGTGCHVLVDGAIVEVDNSSLIPDVVVTCEALDFSTPRVDQPVIVVEILSLGSEKDDLGRKLIAPSDPRRLDTPGHRAHAGRSLRGRAARPGCRTEGLTCRPLPGACERLCLLGARARGTRV